MQLKQSADYTTTTIPKKEKTMKMYFSAHWHVLVITLKEITFQFTSNLFTLFSRWWGHLWMFLNLKNTLDTFWIVPLTFSEQAGSSLQKSHAMFPCKKPTCLLTVFLGMYILFQHSTCVPGWLHSCTFVGVMYVIPNQPMKMATARNLEDARYTMLAPETDAGLLKGGKYNEV